MFYEERSSSFFNVIYSIGLGLLPLLSLLDLNFHGITVERIFLIIFSLIAVVRLCTNYSFKVSKKPFFAIFLYCLIISFNIFYYESCGLFGFVSLWIVLIVDLAISPGIMMDFTVYKKTVSFVAIICTVLIFLQYVVYYGIGSYWNPIPTAIYRKDVILAYSNFLSSGLEGNLLRPSAIFLEPSHFAEYSIIALVIQLFFDKDGLKKSVIITIGILLSTSGLGIIAATIAWGIKIFGDKKETPKKIATSLFGIVAIIVVIYFIMESIGVASLLLSKFRINSDNSGFISRYRYVEVAFRNWSAKEYLIGVGFDSSSDYWLPGFFSIVRQIGIVGLFALLVILVSIFKISDKMGKCLVIVYAWLLMVAEVSTMTYMVFYLSPACFIYLSSFHRNRVDRLLSCID